VWPRSQIRSHPRGLKKVPLNCCDMVSYLFSSRGITIGQRRMVKPQFTKVTNQRRCIMLLSLCDPNYVPNLRYLALSIPEIVWDPKNFKRGSRDKDAIGPFSAKWGLGRVPRSPSFFVW